MTVKMFVKDGCSKCPAAKVVAGKLKEDGIEVQEYSMETAEGLAEGVFYGVMATPTMMVVNGEDEPVSAWRGIVPAPEEVKQAIAN